MKRPFIILLALIVCVLGGACVEVAVTAAAIAVVSPSTADKLLNPQSKRPVIFKAAFNEVVTSFFMTKDQQQFVVVGQDHHYIFPLTDDLKRILLWQGLAKIEVIDLYLKVRKGNVVNASFKLMQRKGAVLTNEEVQFLRNNRFDNLKNSDVQRLVFQGRFSNGTVYAAGKFIAPPTQAFKKPFNISIHYSISDQQEAELRSQTPLAVAKTGEVVIGTTPTTFIDL